MSARLPRAPYAPELGTRGGTRRAHTGRIRGRVLLHATVLGVVAEEILGLCISAVVLRHYDGIQVLGLVLAAAGAFLYRGDNVARMTFGLGFVAVAGLGGWHLVSVPHGVSLHSVLLWVQSSVRAAAGAVALGSRDLAAHLRALRTSGKRRP